MPQDWADLESKAYDVADEHRAGRLEHLTRKEWRDAWRNLVEELKFRGRWSSLALQHRDSALRSQIVGM